MIYGLKTRLRRIERADIPTFVRWFGDPKVRQFLMLNRPISVAEEERWFESQLVDPGTELFAIETAEGVHIGNIGLHDIDWLHRRAELGIVIGEREFWNQGYGSDAVRTLLGFAFREMNLHRVHLRVFEDNVRALRVYEKCGFQHEGCLRQAVYRQGRYCDEYLMGILSHEFEQTQTPNG
jgi:UDP-4-amino-4,6-dideoxy-N-acetyl-beta-L-altrosamine N-acetyltransferase